MGRKKKSAEDYVREFCDIEVCPDGSCSEDDASASEHENWTDVEKTFGVKECWKILGKRLNESCIEKGANGVATVDFAACKMGCANNPEKGSAHVIQDMPNGTPCGLYNETCQSGTCKGECFIPTETIEDIETK